MSQQIINISTPDDGLGDVLRNGFNKTNQNFTELYNGKVDKVTGKGLSENNFTDANKTKLDGIETGAEVNVQADWGETDPLSDSFILNKPPSLYSAFGYFHYSDLSTQTTPLVVLPSVPKKLTNDTLGTFTNRDQAPYGISGVWNTSTNALDFSQLSVGDGVLIRTDLSISTTSINQKLQLYIKFGIGTPSEYDLLIDSWYERSVITFKHFLKDISFSIDNEDWRDAPAEIYIYSDNDASIKVNGWYIPIIRKSINIVDFDDSLLVKKSDFQTVENTRLGTNVIVGLPLNGASYINFTNPLLESISGVSFLVPVDQANEPPYPGKPFIFKNLTGNPITIKNNQSVLFFERAFLTKDGLDIVIPNGEHIRFNYGVKLEDSFRSWGSGGGGSDIIEVANLAALPATGEVSKIYITIDTNLQYRWTGSAYVQIGGGSELDIFNPYQNGYYVRGIYPVTALTTFILSGINNTWSNLGTAEGYSTYEDFALTGSKSAATPGKSCGFITTGSVRSLFYASQKNNALISSFIFRNSDASFVSDARFFVGYYAQGLTIGNVNPSTLTNCIGFGADSGDSNIQLIHNDSSGTATKIDLGVDFPANTSNVDTYKCEFFIDYPNDKAFAKITRLNTDNTTGTIEINSNIFLGPGAGYDPWCWRNNGSTGLEVKIRIGNYLLAQKTR